MTRLPSLALLLSLAACGGGDHGVASGTVGDGSGNSVAYVVKQEGDGTTTTVRSSDGSAVIRTGDATAAAAFPPGFALYPGAQVVSNMSVESAGDASGAGAIVAFESADTPDRILAFYRAAAERAGYKVESEISAGAMAMIGGKREGDDHGFTLTVNRTADKSEATLIGGR